MINRHSVVLFIVLVAIGFGLFTMVNFQKKNAFTPAAPSSGGGLVINVLPGGILPATGTAPTTDATPAPQSDSSSSDGAACP